MNVILRHTGKDLTAEIIGEIDHHSAGIIREQTDSEIERLKPANLRLDFSKVTFMDSSGIGLIMGRYRLMKLVGGNVSVVNVPASLQRMIQISGISSLGVLNQDWSEKNGNNK